MNDKPQGTSLKRTETKEQGTYPRRTSTIYDFVLKLTIPLPLMRKSPDFEMHMV